jgi:DNA replication protein DnaC
MKTTDMLKTLQLQYALENLDALSQQAQQKNWSHRDYLDRLLEGECERRQAHATARRLQQARFPVSKTLGDFDWNWPTKINRAQVQDLFRLEFVPTHANVIFVGDVGLGKTHLATALGRQACEAGHSVRFTTAVGMVNTLAAAHATQRLRKELRRYTRPALLVIDELGYLPIDKLGADLLFQVFSARYERGAILLTTNKTYKHWPGIFNNDATLASAVLDRLLHHAETVVIQGKSYRTKERVADVG